MRMAECKVNLADSESLSGCLGGPGENDRWPLGILAGDDDFCPTGMRPNPGSERFCKRFLGSKACGEVRRGIGLCKAIVDFTTNKNLVEKSFATALMQRSDADDFHQIIANSKNFHWSVGHGFRVPGHRRTHLRNCRLHANENCPRDDAMADVEFYQMPDAEKIREIFEIDAMSGIYLKS